MNVFKAGNFTVTVFHDGYPITAIVEHKDESFRLQHYELRDLRYVLKKAMKAARRGLPENQRIEV